MRHALLALIPLLAACAMTPGTVASSPYHGPSEADISLVGGGGGGGGGGM